MKAVRYETYTAPDGKQAVRMAAYDVTPRRRPNSKPKAPCMGCGKNIGHRHSLCASCSEDMGYSRRAR